MARLKAPLLNPDVLTINANTSSVVILVRRQTQRTGMSTTFLCPPVNRLFCVELQLETGRNGALLAAFIMQTDQISIDPCHTAQWNKCMGFRFRRVSLKQMFEVLQRSSCICYLQRWQMERILFASRLCCCQKSGNGIWNHLNMDSIRT